MTSAADSLIDFYCGTGTDHRGRSFATILRMDDTQLERTHDYIQWLFPTVTASRFNPDAPTLDPASVLKLRADTVAQERLRAALVRMLTFYGLELDDIDPADPDIIPGTDFAAHSQAWLTPGNHNYQRLTRILSCLVALGRRPHAEALFRCLEHFYRCEHGAQIGDQALAHWRRMTS